MDTKNHILCHWGSVGLCLLSWCLIWFQHIWTRFVNTRFLVKMQWSHLKWSSRSPLCTCRLWIGLSVVSETQAPRTALTLPHGWMCVTACGKLFVTFLKSRCFNTPWRTHADETKYTGAGTPSGLWAGIWCSFRWLFCNPRSKLPDELSSQPAYWSGQWKSVKWYINQNRWRKEAESQSRNA